MELGLTAQRIWQDLVEEGFSGRYASVKRFVHRLGAERPLPFRRMECLPGEEAQIDFGPVAVVMQPNGRAKRYPVLRVVLSHSRKGYSEAVLRQGTEEFLRALENAFRCFGGVPRILVPDNLKAAVLKADWYDPEINPKLQAFCRHYGCAVLPTKPRTPRHKGKVESGVRYVSENALKGRRFTCLQEANETLREWETKVADRRIHGTTKQQVQALFEQERPSLLPLPPQPFPCFHEAQRTVGRDAHVEVEKAYYSVPPEYMGHVVWVRWDTKLVRIFNQRLEAVTTHLKDPPGRFRTHPHHLASEKISSVERGAGYLLKRIEAVGPQTLHWAQRMLEERGIEGVRVLQGLLSMAGRHRKESLESACALALSHGGWRLQSLRQLMKEPTRQTEFIEVHPLIRPMEVYGRYFKVSFGKEYDHNDNGEFIALQAPSGEENGKSPDGPQALSAVQPPTTALRSLSSVALSSAAALEKVTPKASSVNSLERTAL
jgi:transposase